MAGPTNRRRLLVKTSKGIPAGSSLTLSQSAFRAEPLFKSVGRNANLSVVGAHEWYLLESVADDDSANWDFCHRVLSTGLGITGADSPEFIEPDLQQRWAVGRDSDNALAALRSCDQADPQNPNFPQGSDTLWYKAKEHSDFPTPGSGIGKVRIAHLDTGYDPNHKTLPKRLARSLARNFVDADKPNDATDNSGGLFNNLGHGTGTLSILAGEAIQGGRAPGAATGAVVIPVRVANSVVLFYNSGVARGLDYAHALCRNPATAVNVVTMSMGGLASQAWADAVNALYEAGVFVVTAAGNNYGNLPTKHIVFPARFNRVVAACGVMADYKPYADLPLNLMAGNYGPPEKMGTAIAACTPNIPWARFGCSTTVDQDGAGTSAATPQIAAAAALWISANRPLYDSYKDSWQRAEAVRQVLFATARNTDRTHFGRGELDAKMAVAAKPPGVFQPEPPSSADFPLLRTAIGMSAGSAVRQRMLELEALQLSQSAKIESITDDAGSPADLTDRQRSAVAQALADDPRSSRALRDALAPVARSRIPSTPALPPTNTAVEQLHLQHAVSPQVPKATRRKLRVYAYDPSLESSIETLGINRAVVEVPWEDGLSAGPCGEYLEVVDVDPASGCCYAPIDLNDPHLIAQDGLAPSESNPQFHQQMVYAVAMKTVEHFERALGRVAQWAPRRRVDEKGTPHYEFVQRLRIYPHALRAANAFYSPERKALMLGYFKVGSDVASDVLPGGTVFGAVSHDIVAHETTHALLDGLHRRFREATNPDVLAFHEAFADIVALMQHFTLPDALLMQIAETRGRIADSDSLLGKLAVQFGHATGRYGALRDAIGATDAAGDWKPRKPTRSDYSSASEPHDRGAVLVSAVFSAFTSIYEQRAAEIVRLATGGTGVLPAGNLSAELAIRLAKEASKVARQVLEICVRALDYCPPIDITFGEYLRALITADRDLVPDDRRTYRVAFVAAFRDRGIYPSDVRNLSVDSLAWEPPPIPLTGIGDVLRRLSLKWDLKSKRREAYELSRDNARIFHEWLIHDVNDADLSALGFRRSGGPFAIGDAAGTLGGIEVHSVRPARRIGPDGQMTSDLVIEITQSFYPQAEAAFPFRGGCTLLVDIAEQRVKYFVRKRVDSAQRFRQQQETAMASIGFSDTYGLASNVAEPFAALHGSM